MTLHRYDFADEIGIRSLSSKQESKMTRIIQLIGERAVIQAKLAVNAVQIFWYS